VFVEASPGAEALLLSNDKKAPSDSTGVAPLYRRLSTAGAAYAGFSTWITRLATRSLFFSP